MGFRAKKKLVRIMTSLVLALLLCTKLPAQLNTPELPGNSCLTLATENFNEKNYTLANHYASQYLELYKDKTTSTGSTEREKAKYYIAVSKLKTGMPGCADSAAKWIGYISNPDYKQRIYHALAQYYFRHNQLEAGIPYYEKANIANLSNDEIAEEKFELAYCYFTNRQFDKAEPLFASIKELKESKYFAPSNYYYALLAYNNNKYPEALKSFERIKDVPEYKNAVPYYIAEIYYFTGDRKKALEDALNLIKRKDKLYYDNETRLLAAQCLFEEQRFADALPHFEYYYEHTEKIRKEDLYEMGFCYYMTNLFEKAIEKFKLLSSTQDSLGQTAMYLLGDCYLKTKDKQSARNAFAICADLSFNAKQQETSMILNARLCYEMGYNDEAAKQLHNLLNTYPGSQYKDEAKTMLSELLLKTSNYAEAFKMLQEVNNRDTKYKKVLQKVSFGYALQAIQEGNTGFADSLLTISLKDPDDEIYAATAYFWKGELAYRAHKFADVINFSRNFINRDKNEIAVKYLSPQATLQNAYLNMGYAAMELNNYPDARQYFSLAQKTKGTDSASNQLAMLREADAYFMQKDYSNALSLYNNIIANDKGNADYALFQKSVLYGLQGNTAEKISTLQNLMNKMPPSRYAEKARYELGQTYMETGQYQAAISILEPLTKPGQGNNYAAQAWMKTGFAYRQMVIQDKAIEAYKHVVTDYPGSEERPAALDALKSLYIENNQPGEYTRFLKENKLPSSDSGSIDSTYYAAAEAQYIAGKWDKAKDALIQYLRLYPRGAFTTKAHYYLAESEWQMRDYTNALGGYQAVLENPWNDYSEQSARRAAIISYQGQNYQAALNYYQQLRTISLSKESLAQAYIGMMKSSFNITYYKESATYADTLLSMPEQNHDVKKDAQLYKAKSLQELNKPDEAMEIYHELENNKDGAVAAEAKYHIAEYYLKKNKLKDAEAAANNTIQKSAGYDYWIVKSYILLAEVLTKEKDYFNAKATLQSIIKQTNQAELKQEAQKKLEKVKALEKQQSKLSE